MLNPIQEILLKTGEFGLFQALLDRKEHQRRKRSQKKTEEKNQKEETWGGGGGEQSCHVLSCQLIFAKSLPSTWKALPLSPPG